MEETASDWLLLALVKRAKEQKEEAGETNRSMTGARQE